MRVSLIAALTAMVAGDHPIFCDTTCSVMLRNPYMHQQRVYLNVPYASTMVGQVSFTSATAYTGSNISIQASMPLNYTYGQFTVTSVGAAVLGVIGTEDTAVGAAADFNPYYQTAEFPLVNVRTNDSVLAAADPTPGAVTVLEVTADPTAFPYGLNILFKLDDPYQLTALELVAMPIPQWKTHAYAWTQQM